MLPEKRDVRDLGRYKAYYLHFPSVSVKQCIYSCPRIVDILGSITDTNDLSRLRNRDKDVLGKEEKNILEEEEYALGSENDNYFRTRFKCYKVKYFETVGVLNMLMALIRTRANPASDSAVEHYDEQDWRSH